MDNFVQNLRKKLTQPQQPMRIPQPVARQVNTFVNNLNNMNFQTKRPNPVQFQAPKLEMPKIQLPKFNAIGQSRPNIPQQRPQINLQRMAQPVIQQARPVFNKVVNSRIPVTNFAPIPQAQMLRPLAPKITPKQVIQRAGDLSVPLTGGKGLQMLSRGDFEGYKNNLRYGATPEARRSGEIFRKIAKGQGKQLSPDDKKFFYDNQNKNTTEMVMGSFGPGVGKNFSKQQLQMVRNGFTKDVRDRIGQWAISIERGRGLNKADPLNDYVYSLGETVFGKDAAFLSPKQLLNALDVAQEQAFKLRATPKMSVGLSAGDLRSGKLKPSVPNAGLYDTTKLKKVPGTKRTYAYFDDKGNKVGEIAYGSGVTKYKGETGNVIDIAKIRSTKPGTGIGSKVVESLKQKANETNSRLVVDWVEPGSETYWQKMGFEFYPSKIKGSGYTGYAIFTPQRSNLSVNAAKSSAGNVTRSLPSGKTTINSLDDSLKNTVIPEGEVKSSNGFASTESIDNIIPQSGNGSRVAQQPKGVTPEVNPNQLENLVSGQLVKGEKAAPSPQVLSSQIDELASGQKIQLSKSSELLPENSLAKSGSGQSPVNPPSGVIVPKTKYAFNINKDRLKMNPQQKKTFDSAVSAIKPELEKLRGKKLSFNEVREEARTAEILRKTVDRSSTEKFEAGLLATRERMNMVNAEIDKLTQAGDVQGAQRLYEELSQLIKVNSSNAADIGRKLGSFRIMAEERPFRERVLEEIIRTNKMSKEIEDQLVAKAANIDWNDARQVTKLFREFVKPSVGKMLEEYRYINLLSSPRTHITNAFSNLIQAGITRPVTKLASGIIDPVASALTGKEREFYISEVPVYYRGMIGNMPKAFDAFKNVMSGKVPIRNLDMRTLQSGTALTKVNVVSKALSGMDEFFQTIIKGGESEAFRHKFAKSGKIVKEEDITKLADQEALYSVFRRPLDSQNASGQGSLLSWVDKGTEAILGLRRVPGVGWFIPFVQTPMNIFKQGIEYSPLGVATLKGSANKTEQLAKTMVGSTVLAGAGFLAMQDKLTWDTPKDPEAKKAFYAAGYQPYSMKIGDKWVSYSRLGPLAYPLALAAAVKYAYKDDPNAVANGDIDKITNSLTGIVGFFGDQTYVQGLGNLVKAAQGEEGYSKATATLGNVATQYVPLSSLLRWVTGVVDPVYRKSDGVVDQIKKGIPGLSTQVGFYEDPYGEPSKRQYPAGNAFSPFNVTKENPEFKDLYDTRKEELQTNAQIRYEEKRLEKEAKEGVSGLEADASGSYLETLGKAKEKEVSTKTSTFDETKGKSLVKLEAEDKLARKRAKLKQEIIRQNGKIYVPNGNSVKVIDLNPEKKKGTGIAAFVKEKDKYASAREVWNLDIPQAQKNEIFKDLGVDPQDVRYDALTGYTNDVKTQYILSKDMTHPQLLNRLIRGRVVSVSGDVFATDGVLKSLLDQNLISGSEYGTLKKLKLDKNGKSLVPVKAGGSGKKVKYDYTGLASKLQSSPIKLKKTKLNKVKLGRSNSKSGGILEGSNKYLKGFKNI